MLFFCGGIGVAWYIQLATVQGRYLVICRAVNLKNQAVQVCDVGAYHKEINVAAQEKEENSLIKEVKKLVEVKRSHPELFACGNDFELVSDGYPLIFKRTTGKETFVCAVNPSEREYTLDMKAGEILASANMEMAADGITLKPISYAWIKNID